MKSSYIRPTRQHSLIYQFLVRLFVPGIFVVWILFLLLAPGSSAAKPNLRGRDALLSRIGDELAVNDKNQGQNQKGRDMVVISDIQPISNRNRIDHVIIVAGHAVMRLNKLSTADRKEDSWYLLEYQLNQGFPGIISSHIQKGITLAQSDPNSLLIFSGGQTRHDVGPLSEAASYYFLAQEKKWMKGDLIDRVFLDEFARDSFENLLFSLCRFREVQGYYPARVTVVGFDFKANRFRNFHREAIRFPEQNFTYAGLRPQTKLFDYDRAVSGERVAVESFKKDLYGCNDIALKHKREDRNPFKRTVPYEMACPELKYLLAWCGPNSYSEPLPWEPQ